MEGSSIFKEAQLEVATSLFVLVVLVDLAQGLGIADRESQ
jgi:hypothetical protein